MNEKDKQCVMDAVMVIGGGDENKVSLWYKQPLEAFNNKTPEELVMEGRIDDLMGYIYSLEMGFIG